MNDEKPKNEPIEYQINLDERDQMLREMRERMKGHNGIQRGPYIECTSCPLRHGWYVGMDVQLQGWDEEGRPTLKKLDI